THTPPLGWFRNLPSHLENPPYFLLRSLHPPAPCRHTYRAARSLSSTHLPAPRSSCLRQPRCVPPATRRHAAARIPTTPARRAARFAHDTPRHPTPCPVPHPSRTPST